MILFLLNKFVLWVIKVAKLNLNLYRSKLSKKKRKQTIKQQKRWQPAEYLSCYHRCSAVSTKQYIKLCEIYSTFPCHFLKLILSKISMGWGKRCSEPICTINNFKVHFKSNPCQSHIKTLVEYTKGKVWSENHVNDCFLLFSGMNLELSLFILDIG